MKKKLELNKESVLRLETLSKVKGGLLTETKMTTCPSYRPGCADPIVTNGCNTQEEMCPSRKGSCAKTCAETCAASCVNWG